MALFEEDRNLKLVHKKKKGKKNILYCMICSRIVYNLYACMYFFHNFLRNIQRHIGNCASCFLFQCRFLHFDKVSWRTGPLRNKVVTKVFIFCIGQENDDV